MTHFDDLFWLVAVVEAGTLTGAADKYGVTGAAVSKRLRLMEERLGVRLLERNARRLRTTESGQLYFQRGKRLLEAFTELEDNVTSTSEKLQGRIRMNAPLSFGWQRLTGPVQSFLAEHPDVNITLDLDDAMIDINNTDYDVVIRIGKLSDSSAVARRIADVQLVCCAAPSYLKRHGSPQHPADLERFNCLLYRQKTGINYWEFERDSEWQTIEVSGNLQVNNGEFMVRATCEGMGIVLVPDFVVEKALARGDLVPLLTDYRTHRRGVYALYPSRQYLPFKIKRVIDHLQTSLAGAIAYPNRQTSAR